MKYSKQKSKNKREILCIPKTIIEKYLMKIFKLLFLLFGFTFINANSAQAQNWEKLNNKVMENFKIDNYSIAKSYAEMALTQAEKEFGKMHPNYATSLNNLARILLTTGEYTKAEPLYIETLEIIKTTLGEENQFYASALNNLAIIYKNTGNYIKAEPLYIRSIEIYKKGSGESSSEYALSLNNLAVLYHIMGNYEKAEQKYAQALQITKNVVGVNHPDYAKSLNNLAHLYDDIGKYSKAEPLFLQSLEILKKTLGKNHPDYASALNNLANFYANISDYKKAELLYLQGLEITKNTLGLNHPDYANSLNNLAFLYDKMGQYEKAEPLYIQSLEITKNVFGESHPNYILSLNNLALLYFYMGNHTKAEPLYIKSLKATFQNTEQQFSFLSEKEKELYLNTLSSRFAGLIGIGLIIKESNPSITAEVYDNLLKTKGVLLKSSTAMRNAVLSSKDKKLITTYDKWNALKKQIANIYNLPIEKRTSDLPAIESEANDLEKELTRSSSVLSDFNASLNVTWKDIQTQLKPNEAAIEFTNFKYNKDSVLYCALIIKKDSQYPQMVQLFEEKQLTSLLVGLKENNEYAIKSVYGSKQFTETKLYDVIWKPLEQYLKGCDVINYSPSGLLHKISFAALSNADDHYLVDDYKLNMLSSTAIVTKPSQSTFDKNINVSLFGGIDYSIKDTTYSPWNYLEGTLSETDQLNNTFKKQGIKVNYIKEKNATKQEFKTLAATSNIIHIATHGFFFPEPEIIKAEENNANKDIASRSASRSVMLNYIRNDNPLMRSGLVFAGVNDYWNGITDDADSNGILTALDVVNIDLRKNKLVVLSACETGLGDIRGGEGVYGLQRAFKMAGTENIIMSLWKVPDVETSEFMQTFYTLLFTEQNINQAFTETQNLMRKKYDPYYWAAFVLVR